MLALRWEDSFAPAQAAAQPAISSWPAGDLPLSMPITHQEFVTALVAQLPALRRYARALAGRAGSADDLVQDCIEKALRQYDQLRDLKSLGSWLRRILHNLYIDELRRSRAAGPTEDISLLGDDRQLSIPPRDLAAARDFIAAVNALSFEHRQILLLVGLEELSYRQIAQELDIPLGTVMSRLARAREQLRNVMETGPSQRVIDFRSRVKSQQ